MRKLNTAAFFHNRVIQCEKRPEHTHTEREREREVTSRIFPLRSPVIIDGQLRAGGAIGFQGWNMDLSRALRLRNESNMPGSRFPDTSKSLD